MRALERRGKRRAPLFPLDAQTPAAHRKSLSDGQLRQTHLIKRNAGRLAVRAHSGAPRSATSSVRHTHVAQPQRTLRAIRRNTMPAKDLKRAYRLPEERAGIEAPGWRARITNANGNDSSHAS